MTISDPRGPGQGLPATEPEALAACTAVLAEMLELPPEAVDPERPFRALGFDSMLNVAFTSALNQRYGTRIGPADLLEHTTLRALVRHVVGEGHAAPPASSPSPSAVGRTLVLGELRRQLAGLLHHKPEEIDAERAFAELGLDSVLANEFIAGLNHTYGLAEPASVLHDHRSLAALAAHLATLVTVAPRTAGDLETLLDAVRDDVLSIEEAVALLGART
ncbi:MULTISPECIES: acyl carrier protein [unclassified Streptomyces]|uniref:acyl carrier protein n=1 Tax=unclassified Streptomyces TaxID=2593676 RepID=UPI0027411079|nr:MULTISPECIES: acyl carrier protein [unclassified Streptomyces]